MELPSPGLLSNWDSPGTELARTGGTVATKGAEEWDPLELDPSHAPPNHNLRSGRKSRVSYCPPTSVGPHCMDLNVRYKGGVEPLGFPHVNGRTAEMPGPTHLGGCPALIPHLFPCKFLRRKRENTKIRTQSNKNTPMFRITRSQNNQFTGNANTTAGEILPSAIF